MSERSNGPVACAWILALLMSVSAVAAHAAQEVCVQNQQQLLAALSAVQSVPQRINLRQGTYHIDAAAMFAGSDYYMLPGSSIHGGYTADCASRVVDANNTVLASAAQYVGTLNIIGSITFDALSIQFNHGMYILATGQVADIAPGTYVVFNRVKLAQSGTDGFVFGPFTVSWDQDRDRFGEIDLLDSLVVGNNSDPSICAFSLLVREGQPTLNVQNTTVYGNHGGGGLCIYNHLFEEDDGNGRLVAHDNIFYANPTVDLSADSPDLDLVDNSIGFADIPAPSVPEQGRLSTNPNLDADYHPIESPAASVINTGEPDIGTLPATDFLGHARIVGSRVDRGAFESSINDSFVQSVTNANDSGNGSLRAAIESANAGSGGLIGFNIGSGCGPHVIHLQSPLPPITKSLAIIGSSQPGSVLNDLDVGYDALQCIVLDGSAGVADGLTVQHGAGAGVQAVVTGLAFGGFSHAAASFYGGKDHGFSGNRVGGSFGGVTLAPNGTGVIVGPAVAGVVVGGGDPQQRNLILEAVDNGVSLGGPTDTLGGSHDAIVENNYIGVGWNASTNAYVARGNGSDGVRIGGDHHAVKNNLIGYNGGNGVGILGADASDNSVGGNDIGIDDDGADIGNSGDGVRIGNGAHDNGVATNHLGNNAGAGVRVADGRRNSVRKNRIAANGALGIDIAESGENANDGDVGSVPAGYANRGIDHPVATQAVGGARSGEVGGHFLSTPGDYQIDAYSSPVCDASGFGAGARWLASTAMTIPDPATVRTFSIEFSLAPPATIADGAAITLTATDAAGNTSEFSPCRAYVNDRIFRDGFN